MIFGKNKVKVSRYLYAGSKEERLELLFILDLGTPQPRFIHGNGPWYVLDMRLGGPQRHRDYRNNPLSLPGIEPQLTLY
jgi:hypothetical protein